MYKSVTVNGEAGVKATCLLHSVAPAGVPMVTFEIEYPRTETIGCICYGTPYWA